MVGERRLALLGSLGQRYPGLQSVQAMPGRAVFWRGALRMHDAGTCGHPVDVARLDPLNAAQTVAMHHRAFKKIGHRGEPDMRVRTHVHALARLEARRTEMVEKDKRS